MNWFKVNIRYLRGTIKLSQLDFSKEIDVKRTSVASWEQGIAYPNMDKIIQIREYFDVTLDDLLMTNMETAPKSSGKKKSNDKKDVVSSDSQTEETTQDNNTDDYISSLIESNKKLSNAIEKSAGNMERLVKLLAEKGK